MNMNRGLRPSRLSADTSRIWVRTIVCFMVALSGLTATASSSHKHHRHSAGKAASTSTSKQKHSRSHGKRSKRARGQQKIEGERARQIQAALIREHYLSGEATGTWSDASQEAMRRFQADHGWQAKTVPDSRALIALGLGPNNDRLLNPESAMTTVPIKSVVSAPQPVSATDSRKQ